MRSRRSQRCDRVGERFVIQLVKRLARVALMVPADARVCRGLPPPPAVLPEVLLRIDPDVPFEYLRVRQHDRIDVGLAITRRMDRYPIDQHGVLAAGLAHDGDEQHGHVESQREHRGPAWSLGGSSEKWNERAGQSQRIVIADKRDAAIVPQGSRRTAHRILVVNHLHADFPPGSGHVGFEDRIGHPTGHHIDGHTARREVCPAEFPVPEVPRYENDAVAQCEPVFNVFPAFHALHAGKDVRRRCAGHGGRFDRRATEAFVRASGQHFNLRRRTIGKCGRDLPLHNAPSDADWLIRHPRDPAAHPTGSAPSYQPQHPYNRARSDVFQAMRHGR